MDNSERFLTAEKLNDKVYAEIKKIIINKELKPGERLVDSQLAERYGISRTPVRDAIRKLAVEGLVVPNKKKGYFVFSPTRQDILEIYELRLMMDKAVISKIITEMLPSNYSYYEEAINQIEESMTKGIKSGPKHFMDYDETFHDSFIRLTNNSRVINIYDENRAQTKLFRFKASTDEGRLKEANASHMELMQAIKNMDLDRALRCVSEHVETSRNNAIADLKDIE